MSKRRMVSVVVGWGVLVGLGLLFALRLSWVVGHLGELRPVAGGDRAPDFTLSLLQGGRFHMDADESVTVLDFWATWCGPCRQELPRVDELSRKVAARGVRVVAVNIEDADALPEVKRLVAQEHLTVPIALGGESAAAAYKVNTLPHIVVVDRTGKVRQVLLGPTGVDALLAAVDAASR